MLPWLLFSTVVATNALWLLGSSSARAFYRARLARITTRQISVLRILRWSLLLVVVVGVVRDLLKLS